MGAGGCLREAGVWPKEALDWLRGAGDWLKKALGWLRGPGVAGRNTVSDSLFRIPKLFLENEHCIFIRELDLTLDFALGLALTSGLDCVAYTEGRPPSALGRQSTLRVSDRCLLNAVRWQLLT